MPMPANEIVALIEEGLPGAAVEMTDLAGDGDHWAAHVIWAGFEGMNRVKQHQAVYKALKGRMGGELHALALQTSVPQ